MKNGPQILKLLSQIKEYAEEEDYQKKIDPSTAIDQKIGKSWMVFHLDQLETLIKNEEN